MGEGYNKNEAVRIINYMIGPEKMGEDKAKETVNQEIELEAQEKAKDDSDQKVPWDSVGNRRGH